MYQPKYRDGVLEFCGAVKAHRNELEGVGIQCCDPDTLAALNWDARMDDEVLAFVSVPNHLFACSDLRMEGFSEEPLNVAGQALPIRRVLEAFSHTNPGTFAQIWFPLVGIAERVCVNIGQTMSFASAKEYLISQMPVGGQNTPKPPPTAFEGQVDGLVQNLLGSVPGLQSFVQGILANPEGLGSGENLGHMVGHIQGMLEPLMSQASAEGWNQDSTLQPAVQQILGGFTALTSALAGANRAEAPSMVE